MHEHTALFESRDVSYSARDASKLGHGIALSQHLVLIGRKLTVHALFCLTPIADWIVVHVNCSTCVHALGYGE